MKKLHVYVVAMLVIVACSNNGVKYENAESYTEEAAMSIFMAEPEKALLMLDSAAIVGNLSAERAEYLKAVVYSNGLNDRATAKHIATQLLNNERVIEDESLAEDIYEFLASIAYSAGDDCAVMKYAPEAYKLAEKHGWHGEMGKMTSYIALAMAHQGQTDEAIDALETVVLQLADLPTFTGVVAYVSAAKSLNHLLYDTDREAEMPAVCQNVLDRLQYFEQNQDRFSDLPNGYSPDEFLDMSRAQIYAIFCIAEAELGNRMAARQAEQQVMLTNYGRSGRLDKVLVTAWLALGDWQKLDAFYQKQNYDQEDTINRNYLIMLKTRSVAAERRGRPAEALRYERRASVLQDSLNSRQLQLQIAEQAALLNLHEATLDKERAEAHNHILFVLLNVIIVAVIVAIAFIAYFFVTRRNIKQKNKALVKMINEMERESSASHIQTPSSNSDKGLYSRLCALVVDNILYADVGLDREKVADMMGISRHTLNDILNTYADGQSFPQWLNDIRITEACHLLHDNLDMSIGDIAAQVGLTPDNLRRLFRQRYGITPTEYRQNR